MATRRTNGAGGRAAAQMAAELRRQDGAERPLIPETHFRSWESFKSEFSRHLFGHGPFVRERYLFRGHSDPSWRLWSTFDRTFANQSMAQRLRIAEQLLTEFRRILDGDALSVERRAELRSDESRLLALGQHYGLPTRLLDWTESPYVAAFFAYNSIELLGAHDQQIVVWVLDATHPIWSSDYGVEIVSVPTGGNERIRNQSGKFTLARTPFATLEEYVHVHKAEGTPLQRFLLPAHDSARALADLDAMGIHHGTVYPEIEGAAQMALFRTVRDHKAFMQTPPTSLRPS